MSRRVKSAPLCFMDPIAVQPSTQRALAAIVLTDAVSFSARMSVDEEGTLALIRRDLQLMADLSKRHGGRVLKSTGDGLLMFFVSAVQAVRCSQAIQKQLASNVEGLLPQEYLQHRIGIHLGDVLFSHGDVLGNGVNIAARLQNRSLPGGICISQTVYDTVKAPLRLKATFLGPLRLKNIKEPVPAFQIPPIGQAATMLVQPTDAVPLPVADTPLARAVQTLQADAQHHRIKKLIFSLCQGVWENDPVVLSQFDLRSLLASVYQQYPALADLEEALENTVSRLNRAAKYLAIADVILQSLRPVYAQGNSGEAIEEPTTLSEGLSIYDKIAEDLGQQPQPVRIKKLLYAIAHGAWENDAAALAQQPFSRLVAEVHTAAPGPAALDRRLDYIIQRLSQPSRYAPSALLIQRAFQTLHGTSEPEASPLPESAPKTGIEAHTLMAADIQPSSPVEETFLAGTSTAGTLPSHGPESLGATPEHSGEPFQGPRPRDRANLLTLRLEIMRYTNPLRAKILLLSTLQGPFSFSQQDWITLKSKALDELVQEVFEYCSSYGDLESKLTIMSHCVDNTEENTQAIGVILTAMKPFYPVAGTSLCAS